MYLERIHAPSHSPLLIYLLDSQGRQFGNLTWGQTPYLTITSNLSQSFASGRPHAQIDTQNSNHMPDSGHLPFTHSVHQQTHIYL